MSLKLSAISTALLLLSVSTEFVAGEEWSESQIVLRGKQFTLEPENNSSRTPFPGKRDWGPEQATGTPDTPKAGDKRTAWASLNQNNEEEWLELGYGKTIVPVAVMVFQTHKPGAIYRVTVFNEDGLEKDIWKGTAYRSEKQKQVIVLPVKSKTTIRRVKLYLHSAAVPGWNEIDAVGVIDEHGKTHWARTAKASSTYASHVGHSGRRPTPVSEQSEVQRRIERLEGKVEQLNQSIRHLQESIDDLRSR